MIIIFKVILHIKTTKAYYYINYINNTIYINLNFCIIQNFLVPSIFVKQEPYFMIDE